MNSLNKVLSLTHSHTHTHTHFFLFFCKIVIGKCRCWFSNQRIKFSVIWTGTLSFRV